MSTHAVAQCASSLRTLASTASTLRRIIRDTEPKVGSIDAFAFELQHRPYPPDLPKPRVANQGTSVLRRARSVRYLLLV